MFFVLLIALIVIAAVFQLCYGNKDNFGIFLVTALTAIGTCGVTILNVFPYEHKDKLEAKIYYYKKGIRLAIDNKSNHPVYLGTDDYSTSDYHELLFRWWPTDKDYDFEHPDNGRDYFAQPGANLVIPPRSSIWFPITPKPFGKNNLSNLKIRIFTSSGYKFDVQNNLTKKLHKG